MSLDDVEHELVHRSKCDHDLSALWIDPYDLGGNRQRMTFELEQDLDAISFCKSKLADEPCAAGRQISDREDRTRATWCEDDRRGSLLAGSRMATAHVDIRVGQDCSIERRKRRSSAVARARIIGFG